MHKIIFLSLLSFVCVEAKPVFKPVAVKKIHKKQVEIRPITPKPLEERKPFETKEDLLANKNRTYLLTGIGGGVIYQAGTFHAREEQTISYNRSNNTYSAQGFLGALRMGVHTEQGVLYLGSDIYGFIAPIKKRIYYHGLTHQNNDQVHVSSSWGAGIDLKFGFKVNQLKPYIILGVEYNPKELRYQATAPGVDNVNDVKWRRKNVVYPVGVGLSGDLSSRCMLSFEVTRKSSQDFDVMIPDNAGSIRDARLRVTTPQWSGMMTLSYKINLG